MSGIQDLCYGVMDNSAMTQTLPEQEIIVYSMKFLL